MWERLKEWLQRRMAASVQDCGAPLDDYVASYEFINLRHGWVLDNNGMYALNRTKNYDEVLGFLREQDASGAAETDRRSPPPGGEQPSG